MIPPLFPKAGLLALVLGMAAALAVSAQTPAPSADLPGPESAQADPANWRAVDPENLLIFETTKGRVLIEALPEVAPAHVAQFRAIVRSGDYDGTAFHRVIDGFMAQGGDILASKGRPSGLPDLEGEFTFRRDPASLVLDPIGHPDVATNGYYKGFPMRTQAPWLADMSKDGRVESYMPHCPGVVSTARTDDPNSANSQFFLMRDTAAHLDKSYTAWGRVVAGLEVVRSLRTGEPPANPDLLSRARVAADLPEETRPRVWVQRTDGPAFAPTLAARGEADEANVCQFDPVPAVVKD